MSIKEFLDHKPTVIQIQEFVESEAQKTVRERKAAQDRGGK